MKFIIIILGILMASSATLAQLNEFSVTELPAPEASVVQANTKYPDNALLLIYSDLEGLQFRSSMGAINQQSYNTTANRYEVFCSPVKQMVFVAKPGFMERRVTTINPQPKDVFYYKVEEVLTTSDERGTLSITSNPPQIRIILNDLELAERTPFSQRLPTGTHRVVLQKERYIELDTALQIHKDQERFLHVNLKPIWANLSVRAMPENSEIVLNQQVKGQGDYQATGPEDGLDPGIYQLKVQLEKHYPFETQLTLASGMDSVLNIHLKPITGWLQIDSEPSGATIRIDGQQVGNTPYREQRLIGKYHIELQKGGHLETEKSIVVNENAESKENFRLKNYRKALNPPKIAKWGLLTVGLAGVGTGGYYLYSGINDYNKYQNATTEAAALREQVLTARTIYPIAFAAGGAALIGSLLFNNKLQKQKREWGLTAIPVEGGAAIGYTSNF
ncbi:MAG: PEGA domain-containing protein [Cryomorphaceae bacterium]|nr:MAG: PEGA domain-containing protein [Cryomorphaceae bacterium]